ncbi:MAG: 50S ribosomal protein L11 methyltransferase [Candidatus Thiodiazotropha sp.]
MSWLQLSLDVDETQAPLLEVLFEQLGAVSVTLGDAADQPLLEPPPETQPLWRHTRVTALFEGDLDVERLRDALNTALSPEMLKQLHWERIEDRIWERVWLEHFKPMPFGQRLWVCPVGESVNQPGAVVIELDPGLAFGTGTHPTTALCLEWLDQQSLEGQHVIDFGCGSGILAIAALKLGAADALGVDHDPQALLASRDNSVKNAVSDRLSVCLPDQAPDQPADCLVANILAEPLIQLAAELAQRIRPGGRFALSGILEEQAQDVARAYQDFAQLDPIVQRDEWVLISGTRTAISG